MSRRFQSLRSLPIAKLQTPPAKHNAKKVLIIPKPLPANRFQWWQNGAPAGQPTIVSRLLQNSFQEMQCKYSFPEQKVGSKVFSYGMAKKLDAEAVNKHTLGGWSYNKPTNRLLYVNGEFDGWTGATVSSPFRPGGPKKSTDAEPVLIVPGGGHASDMSTYIGEVNPAVAKVQEQAIQVMVKWIKKHPGKKA